MTVTNPIQPRFQFRDIQGNLLILESPTLHRFLQDLTTSTNTITSETFTETEVNDASAEYHELSNDNAQIEDLIPLSPQEWVGRIKKNHYTAVDRDWVEARNGITVKLDIHSDDIIVANGDGSVITVDAQTLKIKYTKTDSTLLLRRAGTSFRFKKFYDASEQYWRVI